MTRGVAAERARMVLGAGGFLLIGALLAAIAVRSAFAPWQLGVLGAAGVVVLLTDGRLKRAAAHGRTGASAWMSAGGLSAGALALVALPHGWLRLLGALILACAAVGLWMARASADAS